MQLDIIAEFETEPVGEIIHDPNGDYSCKGGGAVDRSSLGPFGLLVNADERLSELTPVFFRPTNTTDGSLRTYFCADETRFGFPLDDTDQITFVSLKIL